MIKIKVGIYDKALKDITESDIRHICDGRICVACPLNDRKLDEDYNTSCLAVLWRDAMNKLPGAVRVYPKYKNKIIEIKEEVDL